jgi:hypothetical protein
VAMNPGTPWTPASVAIDFPFSFEAFAICSCRLKQRTHRPDLPVVGQHQFQSVKSCARSTTLPTLKENTRVCRRDNNSSDNHSSLQGGRLAACYSDYPNVYRPARRNPFPPHSQDNLMRNRDGLFNYLNKAS